MSQKVSQERLILDMINARTRILPEKEKLPTMCLLEAIADVLLTDISKLSSIQLE